MQGGSPWGDDEDDFQPISNEKVAQAPEAISITDGFAPMNQGALLTGTTQMPTGQLIYLQPPSGAAKVVGILVVIYGVLLGVFANLFNILGSFELGNTVFIVLDVVNILLGVATVVGGIMLMNYQRRGVMLLLLVVALSTAVGIGQLSMVDQAYEQMLEEGDISQEEYDAIQNVDGLIQGVGIALVLFCNATCGLLVAIPLMVSNNGLDESKLFG